jgi:hypothetical protein
MCHVLSGGALNSTQASAASQMFMKLCVDGH